MTTRASLKKALKTSLRREGKIKVSDTYPREDLRGKTLTIASKGTTVCNGKGRCASDAHCIGLSVFVTDPVVPAAKAKKDKKIGWRHGTVKICLTHLKDEDGKGLIPLDVPLPARQKRTPRSDVSEPFATLPLPTNGGTGIRGVSRERIDEAHALGDVSALATYARLLKSEHEKMALRLVNAQAKLLERQEVSSELRGLSGVRGS